MKCKNSVTDRLAVKAQTHLVKYLLACTYPVSNNRKPARVPNGAIPPGSAEKAASSGELFQAKSGLPGRSCKLATLLQRVRCEHLTRQSSLCAAGEQVSLNTSDLYPSTRSLLQCFKQARDVGQSSSMLCCGYNSCCTRSAACI